MIVGKKVSENDLFPLLKKCDPENYKKILEKLEYRFNEIEISIIRNNLVWLFDDEEVFPDIRLFFREQKGKIAGDIIVGIEIPTLVMYEKNKEKYDDYFMEKHPIDIKEVYLKAKKFFGDDDISLYVTCQSG